MSAVTESIHTTTEKLTSDLKKMPMYKSLYEDLQKLVSRKCVKNTDFKNTLLEAMKANGMENGLRNTIYHWMRSNRNNVVTKEPLAYLKKAQTSWEKRIHKSLNSMASELKVNLAQQRNFNDKEELKEKWNELSVYDIDLSQYRPVYAPKDFLEVLLSIRSPNYKPQNLLKVQWDFIHLPLKVKGFKEIKSFLQEVARGDSPLGGSSSMKSDPPNSSYLLERTDIGEKVLEYDHAPVTQEYLKRGAPRSLRAQLWIQVLGVDMKTNEENYFENLKNAVLEYDLMVDKLIIKDRMFN